MNIIIVGAGVVGFGLTKYLSQLNHQIAVIDCNAKNCDYISSKLDVLVINALGSSPSALESAGIESADMVIAVTPSDEVNLLVCNFAAQYGVSKRIARVKTDIYTSGSKLDLDKVGITHLIEPEKEVTQKIIQYIDLPEVLETANFQSNNIYLRGYQITEDMPIHGKKLSEIKDLTTDFPMLFVAINRGGQSMPPIGNQPIMAGDKIVAIMPKESFKTFCQLVGHKIVKLKKAVVFGDSLTAIHLAQALNGYCEKIILVDPDLDHGHIAASQLKSVEVVHGDCTDSDFLQEIGMQYVDCFIAVAEDMEDNMMSCILSKNEGAKRVIAVRNNKRHSELFYSLGIDRIINTQQITLDAIIEKIQIISLGSHLKLQSADIEVVHFKTSAKSRASGKSLSSLNEEFKHSVVIGSIIRQNSIIIPEGSTVIEAEDEIIALSPKKYIKRLNKLFNPEWNIKDLLTSSDNPVDIK